MLFLKYCYRKKWTYCPVVAGKYRNALVLKIGLIVWFSSLRKTVDYILPELARTAHGGQNRPVCF
jgi:hypothetical protein